MYPILIKTDNSLLDLCFIFSRFSAKVLKIILSTLTSQLFRVNFKFFKSFLGNKKKTNDDYKNLRKVRLVNYLNFDYLK